MSWSPAAEQAARVWSADLSTLDLGDVTVAFLPDGVHHVEATKHCPDAPEGVWAEHPEVIDDEGLLVMSVGGFLVQTGTHNSWSISASVPTSLEVTALTDERIRGDMIGGGMLDSLAEVGLDPADIDVIVLSHLHLDHIGWLMDPHNPSHTRYFPTPATSWARRSSSTG